MVQAQKVHVNKLFFNDAKITWWDKNNNKHIALVDNDVIEGEEVEEIKLNSNESKIIKEKIVKNNKKQAKNINE